MHRYLIASMAMIWRIRGEPSWSSLSILFGALFGLTTIFAYTIGRLGLSRIASIAVAWWIMNSGANYAILYLLRDYAKAPFYLATIFFTTLLILKPRSRSRTLIIAALLGVAVGVGFGFRSDLLTTIPAVLIAAVLFFPGPLRRNWIDRIGAVAVFLTLFVLVGAPVFRGMIRNGGGGTAHVTILGLTPGFDDALGVDRPHYQWAMSHNDTHIALLVNMFSQWKDGNRNLIFMDTAAAETYGREILLRIIRHFPADMLTRAVGAVVRVLELPVNGMVNHHYLDPNPHKLGITDVHRLSYYHTLQARLISTFGSVTVLTTLAALLLIAARNLRLGIFAALAILFFGGYTVMQFSLRHVFHLEILAVWCTAFVAEVVVLTLWRWRKGRPLAPHEMRWQSALLLGAVLVLGIPTGLWIARLYQDSHVRALTERYLRAPKQRLQFRTVPSDAQGRTVLHPIIPGAAAPTATTFRSDYLMLELGDEHPTGPLIFWTKGILAPTWDNTETLARSMPSSLYASRTASSHIFYPTYKGPDASFDGIEIPDAMLASLRGVYRVTPTADLPLLLWLDLRPDWKNRPAHQRLWSADRRRTAVAFHDTSERVRRADPEVPAQLNAAVPLKSSTVENGRIHISGDVDATNGDFLQYAPHEAKRGDTFIAEGEIRYGFVEIIAIATGQFIAVPVSQPGPFRVVITVPEDGVYTVLAADVVNSGPHDLTIDRAGWVKAR